MIENQTEFVDVPGTEYQTASSLKSPGLQTIPDPSSSLQPEDSQVLLPKVIEACQAVCKQLGIEWMTGWENSLKKIYWAPMKGCECPLCTVWSKIDPQLQVWYEAQFAANKAAALENQANWTLPPKPQLAVKPQRISLPLDPRRGGEILLSEEVVQRAKSQAT